MNARPDDADPNAVRLRTRSFRQWQDVVSGSFVPLEVVSDDPASFDARLSGRVLEDVFFSEIGVSAHRVTRTPELIDASSELFYKLTLQLKGTGLLVQDGKEAVLRPGDIGLYDTSRPYTLTFDSPMHAVVVMFPHGLLDIDRAEVERLTAVRLAGDDGLARAVSPFLRELSRTVGDLDGSTGLRVVHNTVDVISTMLAGELIRLAGDSRTRSGELLHSIHEYISRNLHDPELSPSSIAAANFISTRYLQQIFHKQGTTISQWIRDRRMSYVRRDLQDPRLKHLAISQIAASWGFVNPAHFSKAFRADAGETASEFRSRMLAASPAR
ncbi:helix-turn-helix domain-containing protein [Cnuibacter physcomitrellae]|uniref:AraC-like ligand-binding domain-containing protein n=1 Tax=Cnuibacter physcomitrellae TaxID=1619308 RepID=UPI002175A134|nr:helix-turn-helix domain-containing protein [Cnuibacter physcomitrellae]MCS5497315.1 helix-turn-helix domain-containing protein [Cnuibacter physcomitrellae]